MVIDILTPKIRNVRNEQPAFIRGVFIVKVSQISFQEITSRFVIFAQTEQIHRQRPKSHTALKNSLRNNYDITKTISRFKFQTKSIINLHDMTLKIHFFFDFSKCLVFCFGFALTNQCQSVSRRPVRLVLRNVNK